MLSARRKWLFASLTVAGALILMEGGARLVEVGSSDHADAAAIDRTAVQTDWLNILERDLPESSQATTLYVPDRDLFWRLRPDTSLDVDNTVYETLTTPIRWNIRINKNGHRGRPYDSSPGRSRALWAHRRRRSTSAA